MSRRSLFIVSGILLLVVLTIFFLISRKGSFKENKMVVKIENLKEKDLQLKKPIVINSGLLQAKTRNTLYISKWNVGLIYIDQVGKQKNIYPVTSKEEIGGVSVDSKNNIYIGVADIRYIEETDAVTKTKIVKVNKKGTVLKTINPPEEAYEIMAIKGNTIIASNFHIHGSTTRKTKTFSIFFLDTNGKIKRKFSVDKYIQNPSRLYIDKKDNLYFAKYTKTKLSVIRLSKLGKLLNIVDFDTDPNLNERILFEGADDQGHVYVTIRRSPIKQYPNTILRKYTINKDLIKELRHRASIGDQYQITPEGQVFLLQSNQLKTKLITKLHRIE